jgi:L-rhamnose mutarotase
MEEEMIYELRVYHAIPGKLAALVDRFRKATDTLFKRHKIRAVGYWTVEIGESTNDFYYMLEWDDFQHRESAMNAFRNDRDWIAARDASEKDGPLMTHATRTILTPTDFSALR